MQNKHFQSHNIEHSVYNGYCEIINNHSHPILCAVSIDFEKLKYWVIIEIFETNNDGEDHCHYCSLETSQIIGFIEKERIEIETDEDNTGHQHKIYINLKEKQIQTNDPIAILGRK